MKLEYEIQVRRVEIAQKEGPLETIDYANLVLVSVNQEGRDPRDSELPILSVTIGLNKMATVSKLTQKGKSFWMILFDTLARVGGFSTSIYTILTLLEV